MFNKFPQINRKLTAPIMLAVFITISVLNLAQNKLFADSSERKIRFLVLQNPNIGSLHEKLGQYYINVDQNIAQREYALAEENYITMPSFQNAAVLGSESPPASSGEALRAGSPWQTWLNLLSKKKNTDSDILYWEKIKETYPDYLYANLKLAVMNLQKGESQKAKNYLQMVLHSDPENQEAMKLLAEFK